MGVLIIGSGDFISNQTIKKYQKKDFKIIAADGGANKLYKLGIIPHYSIGDYDSISVEAYEWLEKEKVKINRYPSKKDKTDMELCIEFAAEIDDEIIITGGTGYRLDHTLANILMLIKLHKLGIAVKIEDDHNLIMILEGKNKLNVEKYMEYNLSILPYKDDLDSVSSFGLEYEVDDQKFEFGSSFGVSNVILKENIEINIVDGLGIIIISKDKNY